MLGHPFAQAALQSLRERVRGRRKQRTTTTQAASSGRQGDTAQHAGGGRHRVVLECPYAGVSLRPATPSENTTPAPKARFVTVFPTCSSSSSNSRCSSQARAWRRATGQWLWRKAWIAVASHMAENSSSAKPSTTPCSYHSKYYGWGCECRYV
jgi:hypothetical protein